MSYPKLKKETYNCSGGINLKISQYLAKEGEFLSLQNVDFRSVGALSSAMGTTRYCSTNMPTSYGVGIFNSPIGSSLAQAAQVFATFSVISAGQNNIFQITPNSYVTLMINDVSTNGASTPAFSFAFGASALYGANNWNFFGYQGSTTAWDYSLPKPIMNNYAFTGIGGIGGVSGSLVLYFSIVRQDGLIGPSAAFTAAVSGNSTYLFDLPKVNLLFANANNGLSFLGYSGIQAWVSLNGGPAVGYTQLFGLSGAALGITVGFNYTAVGWALASPTPYDYQGTYYFGFGQNQGMDAGLSSVIGAANQPGLLENYYNQLFMANFGFRPNRVMFSNPGTPEVSDYQNSFDVGDATALTAMKKYYTQLMLFKFQETWSLTGTSPDTFVLSQEHPEIGCISKTAICVWNQFLWFLDARGIYQFDGSNLICTSNKVEDYFLRMNVQAASRTAIMFHYKERNEIWTIIPIDGATNNNICIVYDYMAQGWYTRTIPYRINVDGSLNDMSISNVAVAKLGQDRSKVLFTQNALGASRQFLSTFGASLSTDVAANFSLGGTFPVGMTCTVKSRFVEGDLGNSVEKLWRRLYVDAAIPTGMTFPITVNFYADKATFPIYSTTMGLTAFQNRIDFGIPAKSLAVEMIYTGGTQGPTFGVGMTFLQLNGFTLEYRFQRAT